MVTWKHTARGMIVVFGLSFIEFFTLCIRGTMLFFVGLSSSVSLLISCCVYSMHSGSVASVRKVRTANMLSVDQVFLIRVEVYMMTGEFFLRV